MALDLPPIPSGPTEATVIATLNPRRPDITIDLPFPDLIRDMAVFDQALAAVVGKIRAGVLELAAVVAGINTGDLSGLTAQLADKASVASVTALAQSVAQLISDAGSYARVEQLPTNAADVGADPAGAAAAVRTFVLAGYATTTSVGEGLARKLNVETHNSRQIVVDAALAARPTTTEADARYATAEALVTAVADRITLTAADARYATPGAVATAVASGVADRPTRTEADTRYATPTAVAQKYTRPSEGIPAADLAEAARAALAAAGTAVQPGALNQYAPLVAGKVPAQYLPDGTSGGSGTAPTVVDGGGAGTTSQDTTIDGGGAAA